MMNDQENVMDLVIYKAPADLPAHLRQHCKAVPRSNLQIFHHPFCISLFPLAFPETIETMLAGRADRALSFRQNGQFSEYIFSLERPYRLSAHLDLALSGECDERPSAWWSLARQVWMDSEIDESDAIWESLLDVRLPGRRAFMDAGERKAFAALPDRIEVWRGIQAQTGNEAEIACLAGHSWTLSPNVARKFAGRLLRDDNCGWLARMEIPKAEVVAYLRGRGEEEMIIRPRCAARYEISFQSLARPGTEPDLVPFGNMLEP